MRKQLRTRDVIAAAKRRWPTRDIVENSSPLTQVTRVGVTQRAQRRARSDALMFRDVTWCGSIEQANSVGSFEHCGVVR